jgi:hypothetical protein
MAGKCGLPPTAAGEIIGVGGVAPQNRQFLLANPLDRLAIEAGLAERKAQQIDRLIAVLVQCAQRAVEMIAADLKTEFDRVVFQALVKSLAVEFARAFVKQIGGEMRRPGLVGVILTGTAVEGNQASIPDGLTIFSMVIADAALVAESSATAARNMHVRRIMTVSPPAGSFP